MRRRAFSDARPRRPNASEHHSVKAARPVPETPVESQRQNLPPVAAGAP